MKAHHYECELNSELAQGREVNTSNLCYLHSDGPFLLHTEEREQVSQEILTKSDKPTKKRYRSQNGNPRPYLDGLRWKIVVYIDHPDGTRTKHTASGKTQKECLNNAEKMRSRKLVEINSANAREADFNTLAEKWLCEVKANGVRPNTLSNYLITLRKHIAPHTEDWEITTVTRSQIKGLIAKLQDLGCSYYVQRNVRVIIKGTFNEALEDGLIASNPAVTVQICKKPQTQPNPFTNEEVIKILTQAHVEGSYLPIAMLFNMGLRLGEMLALTWDDVDIDGPLPKVSIKHTLSRITGKGLVLLETKTPSSEREIPLPSELAELLQAHKAEQDELIGQSWRSRKSNYIFTSSSGTAMDQANLRKKWIATLKNAGVPYKKVHCARHTAASAMSNLGELMATVSRIMGHSSIATTAAYYVKIEDKTKREAVDLLAKTFSIAS
ncbi:unannotated protein [freshwater metagenome]|uniref:Unannotated protein n=1 Tax=freshwater metagenome TaxID=449393 RepID=A0A6J7SNI4_9ZZZZ|nr:tyrosine-type recombinase/integrase [Actinomycetota bacterium]